MLCNSRMYVIYPHKLWQDISRQILLIGTLIEASFLNTDESLLFKCHLIKEANQESTI